MVNKEKNKRVKKKERIKEIFEWGSFFFFFPEFYNVFKNEDCEKYLTLF